MKSFSTPDINLATTLMTMGYEFEGLDRSNGHKQLKFLFKMSDNSITEAVQGYWQRTLSTEPQAWALNFRALKNMLHQ